MVVTNPASFETTLLSDSDGSVVVSADVAGGGVVAASNDAISRARFASFAMGDVGKPSLNLDRSLEICCFMIVRSSLRLAALASSFSLDPSSGGLAAFCTPINDVGVSDTGGIFVGVGFGGSAETVFSLGVGLGGSDDSDDVSIGVGAGTMEVFFGDGDDAPQPICCFWMVVLLRFC